MSNHKFHDIDQNSGEWQALRCGKATASSFNVFMAHFGKAFGAPAERYALQIALERLTGRKSENGYQNQHMQRGHEQEPIARRLYEEQNFCKVLNGGFFDCGEWGASPDGLVGGDGLIEIKSVTAPVHFETLERGGYDPAYHWQLVGHLDCSGRDWVDFCSYCVDFPEEKQLIVKRMYRQDVTKYLEELNDRRAEFLELVKKTLQRIES